MKRADEFERLYRTYFGRVCKLFVREGVPDDVARDLAQDVFMRFYQRMDQFRREAEWTYLRAIARNHLMDYLRMQHASKRGGVTVSLDAAPGLVANVSDLTPDPIDQMSSLRRAEQLQAAIEELPKGMRTVVLMFLEGLTYHEIATLARISPDAVKSRLRDARRRLREQLATDAREEDEEI